MIADNPLTEKYGYGLTEGVEVVEFSEGVFLVHREERWFRYRGFRRCMKAEFAVLTSNGFTERKA